MAHDYNEWIQRVLREEIYDTVFKTSIDPWLNLFGRAPVVGGDRITEKFRTALTSNAAAYTKVDVDPTPSTQTIIKPYWTKKFYHSAVEVENIDISNAKNGGTDLDLIGDAIRSETRSLMNVVNSAFLAQILADVDSSGTAYSDASLSRSTYPTLASYEETTDAAITHDYWQAMINAVIDADAKATGPISGYVALTEQAVSNVLREVGAALHSWQIVNPAPGSGQSYGWQPMEYMEGLQVYVMPGMTTGSVFMLRKQDVKVTIHRDLEIEQVPSGRDAAKFVLRLGANVHVVHPGFQAKLLSKD